MCALLRGVNSRQAMKNGPLDRCSTVVGAGGQQEISRWGEPWQAAGSVLGGVLTWPDCVQQWEQFCFSAEPFRRKLLRQQQMVQQAAGREYLKETVPCFITCSFLSFFYMLALLSSKSTVQGMVSPEGFWLKNFSLLFSAPLKKKKCIRIVCYSIYRWNLCYPRSADEKTSKCCI